MRIDVLSTRQRLTLFAGAALLLPVILVVVFMVSSDYRLREAAVEREALAAARELMLLSDARVEADLTGLRVLAGSGTFADRNPTLLLARLTGALTVNPGWKALVLTDLRSGTVVLDSGLPDGGIGVEEPAGTPVVSPPRVHVGGVARDGRNCPCVDLHVPVPGLPDHLLSLTVDPHVYQAILLSHLPMGAVGGIVDRDGLFLARSIDYADRLGTPGTHYVRDAVARGGEGIYSGRTYEGLENYTAYVTSERHGWSSHVAVNRSLIDGPRAGYRAAVAVGSIAALIAAAGLVGYLVLDLAMRRREERAMLELQKVEALGRFTSTVVHDFNNLLSVMQSALHQIGKHSTDPEVMRIIGLARDAIQRGTRLTNQLLSFARRGDVEVEKLDLSTLVQGIEGLLGRSVGDRTSLSIEIAEDARWVLANRDQMELALVNLAINARDAMGGGGRVTITATRNANMVELSFADSGPGISDHLRGQLFKPFVTTKAPGEGTGLGLAQVEGAVRQAGGSVEARNAPQGGAVIIMRLPAAS
ncbi:ATP-binding protein [Thalassobaculum sp.]|uniref:sensor histidine kinase n=1 Tax=Thalassobaculum sp. TaxID=2022740 RepID=UPI0032EF4196